MASSLRMMMRVITSHELGFASSLGTTTYDLVTAGAELFGARLLLLVPQALETIGEAKDSPLGARASLSHRGLDLPNPGC